MPSSAAISETNKPLDTPIGPSFGTGGVSLVDGVHSEHWQMDWTVHPYQKILLINEGSGYLEDGSFAWPLKKNLVVYLPDNWRYRVTDTPGDPVSLFILFLKTNIFGSHTDLGFEKRPAFFSKEAFAQSGLEHMREIFFEQSANLPGSQAILRGIAWRFLGEVIRTHSRKLPDKVPVDPTQSNEVRVQHFIEELHESFFHPISLERIANRLIMSKRSLTSIFRRHTGTSVLNYVRKLRIDHAKALLKDSDRSVNTIAFECGFDNLSNFYRTFKTDTQCPPKQWRERARLHESTKATRDL